MAGSWSIALYLILFLRSAHGLPKGYSFLFKVDKNGLTSHTKEYTDYELWEMREGVFAIITLVLLVLSVISMIRKVISSKSTVEK